MTIGQKMKRVVIIKDHNRFSNYGPEEIRRLSNLVYLHPESLCASQILKDPSIIQDFEVIMAQWGCIKFDSDILHHLPKLEAVFYAAGSIKNIVTDAFWDRDIVISSAWGANAVSVAQYTVSQILSCLKRIPFYSKATKQAKNFICHDKFSTPSDYGTPGTYGTTLGIISLGMIGRLVCKYIQSITELKIIAYDPYVSAEDAAEMNIELCTLDEIFQYSNVISLHTPALKETEGMIAGDNFKSMKKNSAFINTARGIIVKEDEMIQVLKQRSDITAVLDVTWPEPPLPESELYNLENVILTPHISGCIGSECYRMGKYMVDELERYITGKNLKWQITKSQATIMA